MLSINFGPTVTGPDDGTLIVTANPGDYLRITWALGTDASGLLHRWTLTPFPSQARFFASEASSAWRSQARSSARAPCT